MHPIVRQLLDDPLARRRVLELEERRGAGMKRQAMFNWKRLSKGVPAERVPAVAKALGIRESDVRPDLPHLFPPARKRRNGQ